MFFMLSNLHTQESMYKMYVYSIKNFSRRNTHVPLSTLRNRLLIDILYYLISNRKWIQVNLKLQGDESFFFFFSLRPKKALESIKGLNIEIRKRLERVSLNAGIKILYIIDS